MRSSVNNAMRQRLFTEYLNDKKLNKMKTNFNPNGQNFYGKAKVETVNNITTLTSYETEVASYNHETNVIDVKGYYSQTTAKHINAFLEYYGFDRCDKKELETYKQTFNI